MKTYTIAPVSRIDELMLIGDRSKITEENFWNIVKSKVKEITHSQPDKFDEVHDMAKNQINNQKGTFTILDTCFEIKGK